MKEKLAGVHRIQLRQFPVCCFLFCLPQLEISTYVRVQLLDHTHLKRLCLQTEMEMHCTDEKQTQFHFQRAPFSRRTLFGRSRSLTFLQLLIYQFALVKPAAQYIVVVLLDNDRDSFVNVRMRSAARYICVSPLGAVSQTSVGSENTTGSWPQTPI